MSSLRVTSLVLTTWLLGVGAGVSQSVFYNTSSAVQSSNRLYSVNTNGTGNTLRFTASGSVARCSAMALDLLSSKLFFIDGPSNTIWSVNTDGSGLAAVRSGLTSQPTDLALDVLNQKIYFSTSSTVDTNNTVQVMNYNGSGNAVLMRAGTGGNPVSRCTALAVDTLNSRIFVADAGAQRIWSMSLAGAGLTALATTTNAFPTSLVADPSSQRVYFTASSTIQSSNSVRRIQYNGAGAQTVFTASGTVQRCTAIDLDPANGVLYLSDAAASSIWRIPLATATPALVTSGLPATAKRVRIYNGPSSRPAPGITSIQLSAGKVILGATNGFSGGTYYVLTSTNVTAPLAAWTPILTNVLGASGSFSMSAMDPIDPGTRQRFFILSVR